MSAFSRRHILRGAGAILAGSLQSLMGCIRRVPVERVVEREVTKIVRETVIVEHTPRVVERAVEKVVTVTPAPTPSQTKTTITIDAMDYGWTRLGREITPAFQELFPHLAITWRSPALWPQYPERIAILAAAGQLGDIIEAPIGVLPVEWARQGLISPLDSIIAAEGFDVGAILKGPVRACTTDQGLMALPFVAHPGSALLLFRSDRFRAMDREAPSAAWNLDDLQQAARSLSQDVNRDGIGERYGMAIAPRLPEAYALLNLFGASLLSEDGSHCALTSEEGLSCVTWLYDQTQRHFTAACPQRVVRGPLYMLQSGLAAMCPGDLRTWMRLTRDLDAAPHIEATLFPSLPGSARRSALASGMAYAIASRSQVAREAFQWLKFMASRETGVQMLLSGHGEPGCRRASWTDPRVLALYPQCAQLAEVAETAPPEPLPWNLNTIACMEPWNRRIDELLDGRLDPSEAIALIASEIDAALATRGAVAPS